MEREHKHYVSDDLRTEEERNRSNRYSRISFVSLSPSPPSRSSAYITPSVTEPFLFFSAPSLSPATAPSRSFLSPRPPHVVFVVTISLLACLALLPSTCSAYWPTLQGNSARQGRLTYPFIKTPPSSVSFLKWSVNMSSYAYLNASDLPSCTFGTPAVDSNGTVYVAYSTTSPPLYSGIVSILPNGSKHWITPFNTVAGQLARGSITLSQDQSLLYVVASSSVNRTLFFAIRTATGSVAWRYNASYPLAGASDPVAFGSAVLMGDSRQLYYFADGTKPSVNWKFLYDTVCPTPTTGRVAPSISLYNADIIFTCEKKYILSIFIDDATLKWSTPLICNNSAGCDMTGNAAAIGDDGTIFVAALDNYTVTTSYFNETDNETISFETPASDFYLFTINAGGSIRNRLQLTSGQNGTGMYQIPAIGPNSQYVYVAGYLPQANLWRVNVQSQNFTSVLQLNGNASSPPITASGARGYIADSTADLYACNGTNPNFLWTTQFGDHFHASLAFGEDGTIFVSDSTSGALFAYGCPTGTEVGPNGACVTCPAGTYFVTDGRALCPQCPKGRVSAGGGDLDSCQFCPSDSIPSPDQTQCVVCPPGSEPSFDLTSCTSDSTDAAGGPLAGFIFPAASLFCSLLFGSSPST